MKLLAKLTLSHETYYSTISAGFPGCIDLSCMLQIPIPASVGQIDLNDLSRAFVERQENWSIWGWLWVGLSVIVLTIAVIIGRWIVLQSSLPYYCPDRLFNQLCRQHKIFGKDRDQVRRLAKEAKLDIEAAIFITPDIWQAKFNTATDIRDVAATARLRRIAKRLFGEFPNDNLP